MLPLYTVRIRICTGGCRGGTRGHGPKWRNFWPIFFKKLFFYELSGVAPLTKGAPASAPAYPSPCPSFLRCQLMPQLRQSGPSARRTVAFDLAVGVQRPGAAPARRLGVFPTFQSFDSLSGCLGLVCLCLSTAEAKICFVESSDDKLPRSVKKTAPQDLSTISATFVYMFHAADAEGVLFVRV